MTSATPSRPVARPCSTTSPPAATASIPPPPATISPPAGDRSTDRRSSRRFPPAPEAHSYLFPCGSEGRRILSGHRVPAGPPVDQRRGVGRADAARGRPRIAHSLGWPALSAPLGRRVGLEPLELGERGVRQPVPAPDRQPHLRRPPLPHPVVESLRHHPRDVRRRRRRPPAVGGERRSALDP